MGDRISFEDAGWISGQDLLKVLHLDDLSAFAFFTPEDLELTAVPEDPSDDKYLICAIEGKAEYIISGDHHLLDLGNWEGIRVITARDFLELLKPGAFAEGSWLRTDC
ncbi:MAG: hypothetical protein K6T65_09580 [Peptococcaceae bacterium]|nr:hypothetical protein [Peptococcaceae bacterium]